jgi:hypothetical protein
MTNNKQQKDHVVEANKMVTAVQSIIQKINNVKPSDFCSIETIKQWCEQAKEMEKEQIAKAFDDGDYNYHYSRKTGDDFEDGKEYFNEVYG